MNGFPSIPTTHPKRPPRFPSELHIVGYNSKYGSLANAVQRSDGLAVLGIMLTVTDQDNPNLDSLVLGLKDVTDPGKEEELVRGGGGRGGVGI